MDLKIKIPPQRKRPEDEFKAIFTNPESVIEMRLEISFRNYEMHQCGWLNSFKP